MKTSFLIAVTLANTQFAVATPPAYFLAALGKQTNPADIISVCDGNQISMLGDLIEVCSGNALETAYDSYSPTCASVGATVAGLPVLSNKTSGSSSPGGGNSNSDNDSNTSSGEDDSATGIAPSLIFLVTGLMATSLTSIIFL